MNKRPLFYSNTIYFKINDQSTTNKNQIKRFKQKNEKKVEFGHYSNKTEVQYGLLVSLSIA